VLILQEDEPGDIRVRLRGGGDGVVLGRRGVSAVARRRSAAEDDDEEDQNEPDGDACDYDH